MIITEEEKDEWCQARRARKTEKEPQIEEDLEQAVCVTGLRQGDGKVREVHARKR